MRTFALLLLWCCACAPSSAPKLEQHTEDVTVRPPVLQGVPVMQAPPGPAELPPPPLSTSFTVAFDPDPMQPVSELRQITVTVDLIGASSSAMRFEFVTPSGAVFDARTAALSGDPYQHQTVPFVLMVAGTLIDSSAMSGSWTGRALLDDGNLAGQQAFEVHP
ncbi:MAG: hypothetical protein QM723_30730 [Myxococcaceae bacterium]